MSTATQVGLMSLARQRDIVTGETFETTGYRSRMPEVGGRGDGDLLKGSIHDSEGKRRGGRGACYAKKELHRRGAVGSS